MKSLYCASVWLSCLALLTYLIPCESAAKDAIQIITVRIVGVHDGDSITALAAGNVQLKVRLDGIDAPELKQPFSTQSKQALSAMVFGKVVSLHVTGKDRYKRTLAVVMAGGLNVNRAMVIQGLAWRYEKYSKDAALLAAQNEAIGQRRGLWADTSPVPPWEWRKR
jgi:endonuclease YncB( thermonuclease family)